MPPQATATPRVLRASKAQQSVQPQPLRVLQEDPEEDHYGVLMVPSLQQFLSGANPEQLPDDHPCEHGEKPLEPPPLRYTPNVKYYPQGSTPEQRNAIDEEYHRNRVNRMDSQKIEIPIV